MLVHPLIGLQRNRECHHACNDHHNIPCRWKCIPCPTFTSLIGHSWLIRSILLRMLHLEWPLSNSPKVRKLFISGLCWPVIFLCIFPEDKRHFSSSIDAPIKAAAHSSCLLLQFCLRSIWWLMVDAVPSCSLQRTVYKWVPYDCHQQVKNRGRDILDSHGMELKDSMTEITIYIEVLTFYGVSPGCITFDSIVPAGR